MKAKRKEITKQETTVACGRNVASLTIEDEEDGAFRLNLSFGDASDNPTKAQLLMGKVAGHLVRLCPIAPGVTMDHEGALDMPFLEKLSPQYANYLRAIIVKGGARCASQLKSIASGRISVPAPEGAR